MSEAKALKSGFKSRISTAGIVMQIMALGYVLLVCFHSVVVVGFYLLRLFVWLVFWCFLFIWVFFCFGLVFCF